MKQLCTTAASRLVLAFLLFAPLIATSVCAPAQTPDSQAEFTAAILGKELVLKCFSADGESHYSWIGGLLRFEGGQFRAFALLTPTRVEFGKNSVTIEGTRRLGELRKKDQQLAPQPTSTPVRVVVTMDPANDAEALPKLRAALFFDSLDAALAAIPSQFALFVPPREKGSPKPVRACVDCLWAGSQDHWQQVPRASLQMPKLLKSVEPQFSEAAKNQHISGTVAFAIVVTRSGDVGQVWLMRQLGAGLDDAALRAVLRYRFQPAQQGGEAVATILGITVNFELR